MAEPQIFDMYVTSSGTRLDYTSLKDGKWWLVNFGDTAIPGISVRFRQSRGLDPRHSQTLTKVYAGVRRKFGRRLQVLRVDVPEFTINGQLVAYKVLIRTVTADEYYAAETEKKRNRKPSVEERRLEKSEREHRTRMALL